MSDNRQDETMPLMGDLLDRYFHGLSQVVSRKTLQTHACVLRRFGLWAHDTRLWEHNAFSKVKGLRIDANETVRPLFTVEEFRKLMQHLAGDNVVIAGWTAEDRRIAYWLAVKTGLRADELLRLRTEDLNFHTNPPAIRIDCGKFRRLDQIPIPKDLASAVQSFSETKESHSNIFTKRPPAILTRMLRRDLLASSIPETRVQTVSFHTLRQTCVSWWLHVDRLPPNLVWLLARIGSRRSKDDHRITPSRDWSWLDRTPSFG